MKGTEEDSTAWPGSIAGSQSWVEDNNLPLERIFRNERECHARPLFTQPSPNGLLQWSWGEAVEESRRAAAYLLAQGWPPGSRIAILSKNSAWWIMADFAIWMAGHISVPIFPSLSEPATASILEHSQPVACFVGALDHPLPSNGLLLIALPGAQESLCDTSGAIRWTEMIERTKPLVTNPSRNARDVATLIYTSGTMGEPKGVMQTFEALAMMAESIKPVIAGGHGLDRILSYLPLAHIAERAIVEAICIYQPFHVFFTAGQATFLEDLKRARPTLFFTVPRLLTRFRQGVHEKISERKLSALLPVPLVGALLRKRILAGLGLDSARVAASGSAPLPIETLLWYRRLGLNLIEGYGMTETGITHATLPGKLRTGYVGNASFCSDTRISPEGEVQIKGPMNMAGYYRNPELSQKSFTADGFFKTGDRGEIDEEGRLRIIGRLKEEFKTSKGKYVIPAPIENELNLSGLFDAVCVLGEGLAGPFAAVVLAGGEYPAGSREVRAAVERSLCGELDRVNQKLEHHEQLRFCVIVPKAWTVENGFLTPALKVRRVRVEQEYAGSLLQWEAAGKRVLWIEE